MAQIGKDYYEDLTAERFAEILDELAAGKVPVPGPQNGRYSSEPKSGLVTLTDFESGRTQYNASVARAVELGDTVKRIDGTEVPILTPWLGKSGAKPAAKAAAPAPKPTAKAAPKPAAAAKAAPVADVEEVEPELLSAAREGGADNLKLLKGVGPKLEETLNELGFFHFDQIAAWGPAEIAWVDNRLKFKGRIERDGWIEQAKQLAAGEETEFAKRAKKDKIYD
jgi:NADH-quinone oxidoreductase subunit E